MSILRDISLLFTKTNVVHGLNAATNKIYLRQVDLFQKSPQDIDTVVFFELTGSLTEPDQAMFSGKIGCFSLGYLPSALILRGALRPNAERRDCFYRYHREGHTLFGFRWLVPMGVLNAFLLHGALWSRAHASELILRRPPSIFLGRATEDKVNLTLQFCPLFARFIPRCMHE